jgi:ATP-dependent DNA helicase
MQAMDRAHRIGQTRPVLVLRLCTTDSVEVKLLQRATSKLALERLVIKKGAFQGDHTADAGGGVSLNAQDLLDVLKGNLRLEVRPPTAARRCYAPP